VKYNASPVRYGLHLYITSFTLAWSSSFLSIKDLYITSLLFTIISFHALHCHCTELASFLTLCTALSKQERSPYVRFQLAVRLSCKANLTLQLCSHFPSLELQKTYVQAKQFCIVLAGSRLTLTLTRFQRTARHRTPLPLAHVMGVRQS
jgi:hypothetical protein